jgi:hypothetical protein
MTKIDLETKESVYDNVMPNDKDPLEERHNKRVKLLNDFFVEFPDMHEWLQIFFK